MTKPHLSTPLVSSPDVVAAMVAIQEIKTTVSTQAAADELAAALVEQRLAACVQITGPIVSIYRWQGVINREHEFSVCCKTTSCRLTQLIDYLRTHHPYELPEILVNSFQASTEYADWVHEQVNDQAKSSNIEST